MKIIKNKWLWIIQGVIIIISLLHYFGGPIDEPIHQYYRLLYFIPIILAAFQFGFKGGVVTSIITSLIYSPFILLSIGKLTEKALDDLMDIVLFFAIGIITGTLVEKKNLNSAKLAEELNRHMILEGYTNGIIESIKSGVIAVNTDLLVTVLNKGARDLLNLDQSCVGLNIVEAIQYEEVRSSILELMNETVIHQKVEVTIANNDTLSVIRISVYPLSFEEITKGYVIILDDITELKLLQKQLSRNEKLAALGELSSGIAHEIRNPLGIIKAIEQTMKKELSDNPEVVKELEIIDEEIERANRVVKGLMEFGKPSKQEIIVCTIDSLIDEVLTIMNKYISQHSIQVSFTSGDHLMIAADKDQLKQAFINIIFNAAQAMTEGGKLTISTSTHNDKYVRTVFADTGIGIDKENLERVFNPFFTTKEQGTGLGLPLVQRIIDEHGGMVNVTSRKNEGTAVEILLPVWKENKNYEDDIDCRR